MALKAPGCLALLASVTPFLPGHTGFAPLLGQAKLVTISESLCLRFLLPGVHPSQSGPCPTLCPASPSRVPGLSSSSLCNIYLLRCSLPPRPPDSWGQRLVHWPIPGTPWPREGCPGDVHLCGDSIACCYRILELGSRL